MCGTGENQQDVSLLACDWSFATNPAFPLVDLDTSFIPILGGRAAGQLGGEQQQLVWSA